MLIAQLKISKQHEKHLERNSDVVAGIMKSLGITYQALGEYEKGLEQNRFRFLRFADVTDAKCMRTAKNILEKKGLRTLLIAISFRVMSLLCEEMNDPETALESSCNS